MSTTTQVRTHTVTGLVMAVVGVVLLAFPLGAPLLGWLTGLPSGYANFDMLMPFELFPITAAGVVLILAASLVTRRRRALVGWTIGAAVLATVLGMVWAAASGIANETDVSNTDWRVVVAMALFVLAYVALVAVLVAGVVLAVGLARERRTS